MKDFTLVKTTYPYYWVRKSPHSVGDIFYIHGFADQPKLLWEKFQGAKNYNINAVELPGHFETPLKDTSELDALKYAELCYTLIQKLQLKNPIIMGHSMGGGIAIKLAYRLGKQVSKLILISPMNTHCANLRSVINLMFSFHPDTTKKVKKFYKSLVYEPNLTLFVRTFGKDVIANFATRGKNYKILRKRLSSFANLKDMKQCEHGIVCPTLLIVGIHDQTIDAKKTVKHFQHLIPAIEIHKFSKSGHFTYLEEPQLFNEVVEHFINLVDKPSHQ